MRQSIYILSITLITICSDKATAQEKPKEVLFTYTINIIPESEQKATPKMVFLTGKVIESDLPLPGATIQGGPNATQTDFDGNFTLTSTEGEELKISFMGMVDQVIKVESGCTHYEIEMEETPGMQEIQWDLGPKRGATPNIAIMPITRDQIEKKRTFVGSILFSIGNLFR